MVHVFGRSPRSLSHSNWSMGKLIVCDHEFSIHLFSFSSTERFQLKFNMQQYAWTQQRVFIRMDTQQRCPQKLRSDTERRSQYTLRVDTQEWCLLHMLRADAPSTGAHTSCLWSCCAHGMHALALMSKMELASHTHGARFVRLMLCAPTFDSALRAFMKRVPRGPLPYWNWPSFPVRAARSHCYCLCLAQVSIDRLMMETTPNTFQVDQSKRVCLIVISGLKMLSYYLADGYDWRRSNFLSCLHLRSCGARLSSPANRWP